MRGKAPRAAGRGVGTERRPQRPSKRLLEREARSLWMDDRQRPRAALYARVSTDRQTEKYGLEAQLVGLRKRAQERGYDLVADGDRDAFVDDGFSGGDLNRPAIGRLRRAVANGQVDVVLCYDPDRLSRSLKDQLLVTDEFEHAGRLEFLTQEMDASPEGNLFFAIRGAVSEFEKEKIRERTQRGKQEKARQGQVVNPGLLPAWLTSGDAGRTVQVVPEWATIACDVYRWFTEEGLSLRAICQRLYDLDVQTPSGRGTRWQPCTVKRWLSNAAAMGEYRQLATVSTAPRRPQAGATHHRTSRTDPTRGVVVPVPPIIPRETWEIAQHRLRDNLTFSRRNARRFYLLRGLLFCSACDGRMAGFTPRDGVRRYRCGSSGSAYRVDGRRRCDAPVQVKADDIEAEVWDRVTALFLNPAALEEELGRRQESGSPTRDSLERELSDVERRLGDITAALDRILSEFARSVFTEDEIERKVDDLRRQRQALSARRSTLRSEIDALGQNEAAIRGVKAFAERMASGVQDLDDEGRADLLRKVVRRAVVERRGKGYVCIIDTVLPVEPPPDGPESDHLRFIDSDRGPGGARHGPQPPPCAGGLGRGMQRLALHAGAQGRVVRLPDRGGRPLLAVLQDMLRLWRCEGGLGPVRARLRVRGVRALHRPRSQRGDQPGTPLPRRAKGRPSPGVPRKGETLAEPTYDLCDRADGDEARRGRGKFDHGLRNSRLNSDTHRSGWQRNGWPR